jgi:CubicO group peptidase (beta-lactamase class C family)
VMGSQLPKTVAALESGVADGSHLGAVVFAALDGVTAADFAVGEARPGVPMTPDSIVLWMSASKPMGAAAIMQLVERNEIALDDAVTRYLPPFAAGGKEAVTVRQLLTHTCGFRWVDLRGAEFDWDEIIRRICAAPLEMNWIPGEKAGYHPYTSWYILGELIRQIDGRPFETYVREEIFLPLGMLDSWIGMPQAQLEQYGTRVATTYENDRPSKPVHRYSMAEGITTSVPGGNGHGPARELARFYEMLRQGGTFGDAKILSPASVEQMTRRQREGMYDSTFRHTVDFGLGLIINSARYGAETVPYGYGPYASDSTFGHSGNQSSVAFCDPGKKLVAAVVFNGMPGEAKHQRRMKESLAALYEDLGLA